MNSDVSDKPYGACPCSQKDSCLRTDNSKAFRSEQYTVMTPEGTYSKVTDITEYLLGVKGSTVHICLERDELNFDNLSSLEGVFGALESTGKRYDIHFFTTEKRGNGSQKDKKLKSRYCQEAQRLEFFEKSSEPFTDKDLSVLSHTIREYYKKIYLAEVKKQAGGLQCRDIENFILNMVDPELVGCEVKIECEDPKDSKPYPHSDTRTFSDKTSKKIEPFLQYPLYLDSLNATILPLKIVLEDEGSIDGDLLSDTLKDAMDVVLYGLLWHYRRSSRVIMNHKGNCVPNRVREVIDEEESISHAMDGIIIKMRFDEISFKDAQHTLLRGLVTNMAEKYGQHLNGDGLADDEDGNAHAERHRSDEEADGKTILVSHLGDRKHEKKYRERFFKEVEEGGETIVKGDRIIDLGIFIKG